MIEMLGVLAIVGVLSVGGIAGYTKAMEMYQSNLQKQQIESFFFNIFSIKDILASSLKQNPDNPLRDLGVTLEALDLLPEGMTYTSNRFFGTAGLRISHDYEKSSQLKLFYVYFPQKRAISRYSNLAANGCVNMLLVLKKYMDEVVRIDIRNNDKIVWIAYNGAFRNTSFTQIQTFCRTKCAETGSCYLLAYLK